MLTTMEIDWIAFQSEKNLNSYSELKAFWPELPQARTLTACSSELLWSKDQYSSPSVCDERSDEE